LFAQEENLTKKKKSKGAAWHYVLFEYSRSIGITNSPDRLQTFVKIVHVLDFFILTFMAVFSEPSATYRGNQNASLFFLKVFSLA
jgi:hypothetical protein